MKDNIIGTVVYFSKMYKNLAFPQRLEMGSMCKSHAASDP